MCFFSFKPRKWATQCFPGNHELINCINEGVVFIVSQGQNKDFWFGNPALRVTAKEEQWCDNSRLERGFVRWTKALIKRLGCTGTEKRHTGPNHLDHDWMNAIKAKVCSIKQ